MGFKIAWMAVQGCDSEQAAAALGREIDVETEWELPDADSVAALPGGWTLVWIDRFEELDKGRFKPLLQLGPAVACALTETVMFFEARGYRGGDEVWRITRDPDKNEQDVIATGDLPAAFETIRRDMISKQKESDRRREGVDYISEIPVDVAKSVCGFRHDEMIEGAVFQPFRQPGKSSKAGSGPGFFARLFGAR